jgi:hypothetical protein
MTGDDDDDNDLNQVTGFEDLSQQTWDDAVE